MRFALSPNLNQEEAAFSMMDDSVWNSPTTLPSSFHTEKNVQLSNEHQSGPSPSKVFSANIALEGFEDIWDWDTTIKDGI